MRWDRFAKGLKQLIVKTASQQSPAPGADAAAANTSIRGAPFGDDGYREDRMAPYSPDNRKDRNDSSQHLSC